jgi:beta-glucosidase/6-phospho-beta-glucosidase/beta-galactosidase
VGIVRYGMPWRLTETAPGRYDWALWDRALEACRQAELEPVVDLCHFGLPDHYAGFLDGAWVEGFCRYVEAFLARYAEPRWFTPVNEPGTTAFCSGRMGGWNDRASSEAEHAQILAHVTLANLEANARIRADRDGWWIGAETFSVPVAIGEAGPDLEAEVARRRALSWAVWDLHFGVEPDVEAAGFLDLVDDSTRARVAHLATTENAIAGHDFYPPGLIPVGGPAPEWSLDDRLDYYVAEARRWHARYRVPFWVAETSNLSLPVGAQVAWLEGMTERLLGLRAEGLPVRGLCWYSRGDQFDWQTMLVEPREAVTEVGLFDVERRPRDVAAAFERLARRFCVGPAPQMPAEGNPT